jgi:hypothetical protein
VIGLFCLSFSFPEHWRWKVHDFFICCGVIVLWCVMTAGMWMVLCASLQIPLEKTP